MNRIRRLLAVALVTCGSGAALFGMGCTEGVTPDCSGANAEKCGPSLSLDASQEGSVLVVPEAGTPTSDAGDAGDAAPRDGGDGGDGG